MANVNENITQSASKRKLGIIAGGGNLPKKIIDYCIKNNRPYYVLAIKENANEEFFTPSINHEWIRIGQAGTGFKRFKEEGIQEIVLIGTIKRPSFSELVPDLRTAAFFAKLGAKSIGDDGILRALVKEIEEEKMKVVGIQEVLPDILAKGGVLTKATPSVEDEEDISEDNEDSKDEYVADDYEDSYDDSTGSDADINQYRDQKVVDEDEDL